MHLNFTFQQFFVMQPNLLSLMYLAKDLKNPLSCIVTKNIFATISINNFSKAILSCRFEMI